MQFRVELHLFLEWRIGDPSQFTPEGNERRRGTEASLPQRQVVPTFHRARRPAGEDLNDLLDTLSRRIVHVLEHRDLLIADREHPYLDLEPGSSLDQLQAASIAYRIAIGPHAGRKALTLYSVPPVEEAPNSHLLARLTGFSLHAATVCEAHQRSRLERLCRYITRPPIATQRLSVDNRGGVVYRYK